MQLDKKLFENRETAHVETEQRDVLLEHGEDHAADRMPASRIEAIHEADRGRRAQLLGAVRMVLDRQPLEVGQLRMPPREARALVALQDAVAGKTSELGDFIYASDRRDLLERALGVLQPDLAHGDDQTTRELQAQFADLTERVAELRDRLADLEDAQDELLEPHEKAALAAAPAAPGDRPKPKPPAVPSDPDAPRPPTTLTGPELPAARPAPTTLSGPELPAAKPAATTLTGSELPPAKPVPTTLTGPELPEAPPAPSTLGDGVPSDAPGADAAGPDAADSDAAKAKRSWWRKPFG